MVLFIQLVASDLLTKFTQSDDFIKNEAGKIFKDVKHFILLLCFKKLLEIFRTKICPFLYLYLVFKYLHNKLNISHIINKHDY